MASTYVLPSDQHRCINRRFLKPHTPFIKTWLTSQLIRFSKRRFLLQPTAL
jgi:hypothetical protein